MWVNAASKAACRRRESPLLACHPNSCLRPPQLLPAPHAPPPAARTCTACSDWNCLALGLSPDSYSGTWPYCSLAPCRTAPGQHHNAQQCAPHAERVCVCSQWARRAATARAASRQGGPAAADLPTRRMRKEHACRPPTHQVLEQPLRVGQALRVWEVEAEGLEHVLQIGLHAGAEVAVKQAAPHIPLLPLQGGWWRREHRRVVRASGPLVVVVAGENGGERIRAAGAGVERQDGCWARSKEVRACPGGPSCRLSVAPLCPLHRGHRAASQPLPCLPALTF